jgi:hypothetical protein
MMIKTTKRRKTMFKKVLKGVVIGGAVLAMAGAANADKLQINLYGASAQYKYWTSQADEFLLAQGCNAADIFSATNADQADADPAVHDRDAGLSVCLGDVAVQGQTGGGINGDTVIVTYTTNASYDGVRAVTADPAYDEDGCGPANRLLPDVETATLVAYPGNGTSITDLTCQDVHIGASDVSARTFQQTSTGELTGPRGGGVVTRSVVFPHDLMDPEALGYQVDRPIIVPFGFFANEGVPFDNLTRLMAVSIFNGQVANWSDFGGATVPMTVCLRHAGSGTAATLDAAVMRGDYPLAKTEIRSDDILVTLGLAPTIWFNKGSSDEMKCVGHTSAPGGIGYADVDKCLSGCGGKYGPVKTMTWQGVNPEDGKSVIQNGLHDFWSAQWLYSNETGELDALIDALALYASTADTHTYWSTQNGMKWEKATDFTFPKKK